MKWFEKVFTWGGAIAGGAVSGAQLVGALTVPGNGTVLLTIGGKWYTISAAVGGALVGVGAAIATSIFIAFFALDRCNKTAGPCQCVTGVVHEIVSSFSDVWDELLPFKAMHNRVDVVVKSRYWNLVESGGAYVHCTGETAPRRNSEILRCYFYDPRVCDAANGAVMGSIIGGAGGVAAAAAIAAAASCVAGFWCILLFLILCLAAASGGSLAGAFVGGQIAKAISERKPPAAEGGAELAVGDYVTVRGNLERRGHDNNANTFWWVTSASFLGRATPGTPRPFSYCELDDVIVAEKECDPPCPPAPAPPAPAPPAPAPPAPPPAPSPPPR